MRVVYVFFFKQKTAYEMRISDWSSDVCSSDLAGREIGEQQLHVAHAHVVAVDRVVGAFLALDLAGDLEHFLLVESRRRRPRGVIQGQGYFRHVAGRPRRGSGKDRKSTRLNSSH